MTRTLDINALELKKETDGEDSLGEDNRAVDDSNFGHKCTRTEEGD